MEQYFSKEGHSFRPIPSNNLNRAILFGDGVFETMLYVNGSIRFETDHWKRAFLGLKTLKIIPENLSSAREITAWVAEIYKNETLLRIRWNIFRSGLGKYTPLAHGCEEILMVSPFQFTSKIKNKAYISSSVSIPKSPWANCKTLNGLPYVMANIEREEKGMDEVILLDDEGFISETGASNIYWVIDGVLYTPSLETSCIAGVSRQQILHYFNEKRLVVKEGKFRPEMLERAEKVFTSNITGISYIQQIGKSTYEGGEIPEIEQLFALNP
ncbi:MAG: aminotransferase class IV [Cyclobacteriaceae bacterium]